MRTTVRLDPEVKAAAERLSREQHIGLGQAVNELARAGLNHTAKTTDFHQQTAHIGIAMDVTNIADTLELLDRYDDRDSR